MFQRKFVEKLETHSLCFITFFFENLVVYEIMWKNIATVQATDDNITWRMCIAYWMPKATYTHAQVV